MCGVLWGVSRYLEAKYPKPYSLNSQNLKPLGFKVAGFGLVSLPRALELFAQGMPRVNNVPGFCT